MTISLWASVVIVFALSLWFDYVIIVSHLPLPFFLWTLVGFAAVVFLVRRKHWSPYLVDLMVIALLASWTPTIFQALSARWPLDAALEIFSPGLWPLILLISAAVLAHLHFRKV